MSWAERVRETGKAKDRRNLPQGIPPAQSTTEDYWYTSLLNKHIYRHFRSNEARFLTSVWICC